VEQCPRPAAKRIEARLRALSAGGHVSAERLSILKKRLLSDSCGCSAAGVPRIGALDRGSSSPAATWSVAQLFGYCGLVVLCAVALIPLVPVPLPIILGCVAFVWLLPFLHVTRLRKAAQANGACSCRTPST
jgi:tight adherence protein B